MVKKVQQQTITPAQLLVVVFTIIYGTFTAADMVIDVPGWLNIGVNAALVVLAVAFGFAKIDKKEVVMKIIKIITSNKKPDEKIRELEQLLKWICESINIFYEQELEEFRKYLGELIEIEKEPVPEPVVPSPDPAVPEGAA